MKHEERLQGVDIRVVACVEALAEKVMKQLGRELIVIFGYRSLQEQAKLYEQGRTTSGAIVTRAMAGQSPHNFYSAIDTWVMKEDGKRINWNNVKNKEKSEYSQQDIDEENLYISICRLHAASVSDKITWGGNFQSLTDMPHWEYKNWRLVRAKVEKIIPNTITII